ncbi:uncharacterized protein LOC129577281 isoform X2 [Sitodiplosis mosellana]|uniref:uncharacterized protein LOC129577281 isoform X2 n=1 Tax=Sitodiplosis mosellana TaxID=263140 RepID=UPI002443FEB6|nr:uncharacterized protein LOC129577281 isoform X2 [Sitodiplosis mosellana]
MYVIFPADELIYMTYGAAIPRFKPRPTLDNLREPLVPFDTLPNHKTSQNPSNRQSYPQNSNASNEQKLQKQRQQQQQQQKQQKPSNPKPEPKPKPESKPKPEQKPSKKKEKTDIFGYTSLDSREPSIYPDDVYVSGAIAQSSKRSTATTTTTTTATTFSLPSPSASSSSSVKQPLPPPSPARIQQAITTSNGKPPGKSKSRLHLGLGIFGSKQQTTPEPARLRTYHEFRVSNPTFTRENISARNYDAFFESGEPVYRLEHRTPVIPHVESDPFDSETAKRPHSFGLFSKMSKSKETTAAVAASAKLNARSRSSDPMSMVSEKDNVTKTSRSLFNGWRSGGALSGTGTSSNNHINNFSEYPSFQTTTTTRIMATSSGIFKDCTHITFNDTIKSHNNVTFKLVKTVSDFTQQLSQLYEHHGESLQMLVSTFRKRNSELRKERPSCPSTLFQAWETFLQEIEADSVTANDIAKTLCRQVSEPILAKTFHRKVQSKKVFTHRESFDVIIAKTEEKLAQCRMDYKHCFMAHRQQPSQQTLTNYIDSHNTYVQQLHTTNAMLEWYNIDTVPQLMQELEDIYSDLCGIVSEAIFNGADIISAKANDQLKRYDSLTNQCKGISPQQDLTSFVKILQPESPPKVPKKSYAAPVNEVDEDQSPIPFRNELIVDRNASIQIRPSVDALKRETIEIETQIKQLQESLESLIRAQIRVLESQLFNKSSELQEDISMKKFDLQTKRLHLAALRAQKELFLGKADLGSPPRTERKLSTSSSSMKTKWLKAFRSLKPATAIAGTVKKNADQSSNGRRVFDGENHNLQEYTYKKITPCDVCSQVLRGHTRQGLRCRNCKSNVHVDCAAQLPKCQAKQKLLRRQKSTSEIVTNRVDIDDNQIYRVLKQAGELSGDKTNTNAVSIASGSGNAISVAAQQSNANTASSGGGGAIMPDIPIVTEPDYPERVPTVPSIGGSIFTRTHGTNERSNKLAVAPLLDVSSSAPHSPRRQKLNLRMKSLSLDSPESTELHGHIKRRYPPSGPVHFNIQGGSAGLLDHNTPPSNNSRLHSPLSPSTARRLGYNRNLRTASVELPDEVGDKSLSSASTSPCSSPGRQNLKAHRLLPTNLYVVLYNFKARHPDELDLTAGFKVTVIDHSDPDWWRGKCLGRVGYFPSKYVARLQAGERPLQVLQNLQISDSGDKNGTMTLLRDQIVVQCGDEVCGSVMVRSVDNRQGICPVKYLQEV